MKILIITPGILPVPSIKGGAVETLLTNILKMNEKTHENNFIIYSKHVRGIEKENEKYQYTEFIDINMNTILFQIQRIIKGVINRLPYIYIGNAFISEVKKNLKKQKLQDIDYVIIENHPLYTIDLYKLFPNKIILHLHNDSLNIKSKKSKKIFNELKTIYTVSNYIKSRVSTISSINDKIKTLHNGINEKMFKYDIKSRKEVRSKFRFLDNDIVYIFSGRMVEEKGIIELILAFNRLKQKYANVKLLIVGDYFYGSGKRKNKTNKILELINENKDNIYFTGFIRYEDMVKYYSAADIQVIPSKWEEPCALTLLEGMAVGLPQILTNSGELNKSACYDNSIIVDKNDDFENHLYIAMEKMLKLSNDFKKMRKNAIEYSKKYTLDTYYSNFIKLLKEE